MCIYNHSDLLALYCSSCTGLFLIEIDAAISHENKKKLFRLIECLSFALDISDSELVLNWCANELSAPSITRATFIFVISPPLFCVYVCVLSDKHR